MINRVLIVLIMLFFLSSCGSDSLVKNIDNTSTTGNKIVADNEEIIGTKIIEENIYEDDIKINEFKGNSNAIQIEYNTGAIQKDIEKTEQVTQSAAQIVQDILDQFSDNIWEIKYNNENKEISMKVRDIYSYMISSGRYITEMSMEIVGLDIVNIEVEPEFDVDENEGVFKLSRSNDGGNIFNDEVKIVINLISSKEEVDDLKISEIRYKVSNIEGRVVEKRNKDIRIE